jgi:hypothetical protein
MTVGEGGAKQGYKVCEIHYFKKSCFGCVFYMNSMVRSGRHPEYRKSCTHRQAVVEYYGENSGIDDREIRGCETPTWCPVGERK